MVTKRSSWKRTMVAFTGAMALTLLLPSLASALSFQETSQSPLPNLTSVNAVATGDFDEDGNDDIAVAAEEGVVVWLSDGDGSFTEGQTLAIDPGTNAEPAAVVVGDFNEDGNLDLAYSDLPYKIYIALGNGDGSFEAPGASDKFSLPLRVGSAQLAVADLDGDGADDLVVTGGIHNSSFSDAGYEAFLSNGDGTFAPQGIVPITIPLESVASGIATGDYNNDGDQDLAILTQAFNYTDYTSNQVIGEAGAGDGTFSGVAANPISLGTTEGFAWAETTANLDGSGGDDLLVTVGQGASTIPLLGSSADFLKANNAGAMTGPNLPGDVTAADVNGDGLDDAIPSYFEGNGSAGVGLSDSTGGLTTAPGSPFRVGQQNFYGAAIAAGDFNGDGYPDIALASNANTNGGPLTQGVAVLINSPEIAADPTELDLGDVEVGNSASDTVTLTGLGAPEAEVSQVVLSDPLGSPFSIVEPEACEALAFEEECELEVEFSPTAGGPATSSLLITANTGPGGSNAVTVVSLSGEGLAPGVELTPANLDFGTADVGGTPVTKSFTISSTGNAPLDVTAVSLSGSSDFTLADPSACVKSLAAGAKCKVDAAFAPTGADGSRTATLTVETDAGDRTADLSGTAKLIPPAPAPKTDPTPPAGGGGPASPTTSAALKLKAPAEVKAGKPIKLKVTVTNTGTAAISGLTLTATAPKNLAKAPKPLSAGNLAAGQSVNKTITVTLKPAATAGKKLKIKVTAAASGKTLATGAAKVKVK